MLRLRIISAIIGIPLILGAAYLGGGWYGSLVGLLSLLGVHEYLNINRSVGHNLSVAGLYSGVILLLGTALTGRLDLVYPVIIAVFIGLSIDLLFRYGRGSFLESALSLWGIIYLGGLGGYLILIRLLPRGALATGLLLLNVWGYDICAYFGGIKLGRHKLAPLISPHKTVEGALAGALAAVILSLAATLIFPQHLAPLKAGTAVAFGLGVSLFSQLGDLLESALKRQTAVKDSGSLIPGHGGILDRFDSLWLAAPFAYYFFLIFFR